MFRHDGIDRRGRVKEKQSGRERHRQTDTVGRREGRRERGVGAIDRETDRQTENSSVTSHHHFLSTNYSILVFFHRLFLHYDTNEAIINPIICKIKKTSELFISISDINALK